MANERIAEPASRLLARELRAAIVGGDLEAGERLPSERVLAEKHGVARNTARVAIRLLAGEGLVTAEHGRGVFVRGKPRLMRFGEKRYSRTLRQSTGLSPFRAEAEAQGRTPRVDCVSIDRVAAPPEVADRLGIADSGEDVVRRENWYFADEEPIQVGVTYSPWSVVEGTPVADSVKMGPGSLYARFEEKGYAITTIREEISARMPTPDEVSGLKIPDGVPVLDLVHTGFDEAGRPFEVTRFVMRADFSGLDYRMKVEE